MSDSPNEKQRREQRPLSHADERRLKLVLEAGHDLEHLWLQPPNPARDHALERLKSAIDALEQAESENLRRLSFHTRNLTPDMTARHLAAVLVPFERLQGKALRDDQILIEEGDRTLTARETRPMRVIADNLRSAFNVGAILRTAECFGVEHVSLAGYTPTPDTDKTARTSLGTEKSVSWSSDPNVHDAITRAKQDGYKVIALETARDAVTLDEFVWPEKCALILGNERFGLDRDVLDQADHLLKIPMHGQKNSLNVGIACGITLAAWRAQLDRHVTNTKTVTYKPIGVFRSSAVHPYEAPRQASLDASGLIGTIELTGIPRETLKDLEGFERVWLIYDFHHNKSWKPLVLPPRGAREKRGVFATRSPYRPNSIGLSSVELVAIDGLHLTVRATDLLDGTPILDIKPYVPYADAFPEAKQGWVDGLAEDKHTVNFTSEAEAQLRFLEEHGLKTLRGFLVQQLEYAPLDDQRKRVRESSSLDGTYQLAYRTWRADFLMHGKQIEIANIYSGYSNAELFEAPESTNDRYGDKDLHRAFLKRRPN